MWHPAEFPTPRHRIVYERLKALVGSGPAHCFADACALLGAKPAYRTTVYLVAHLAREIEGEIREQLLFWPGPYHAFSDREKRPPERGKRSRNLGEHKAQIEAILESFHVGEKSPARKWTSFTSDDAWHGFAHRNRFQALRVVDNKLRDRFEVFVNVLWSVLDAAEAKFVSVLPALEKLAGKSHPESKDVAELVPYLAPGTAASDKVFARLSAGWLKPLFTKDVFAHPPGLEVHDERRFSFPVWPQSKYLERVAEEVPTNVADVIISIPSVGNEVIHWDFLKAALRMPPLEAARVVRREAEYLAGCEWVFSPLIEATQKNVERILEDGDTTVALALLRAALAFRPASRKGSDPDARIAKIDDAPYGQIVGKAIPALRKRDQRAVIALLFDLIDDGSDSSFQGRSRVDGYLGFKDPVDYLFDELRSIFVSAAGGSDAELRWCVQELESRPGGMYRRLALHLLTLHGAKARDLVVARAGDVEVLDSIGPETRELGEMLEAQFPGLSLDQKEIVLAAIQKSGSVVHVQEKCDHLRNDVEAAQQLAARRRHKWLSVLRNSLPQELVPDLDLLSSRFGRVVKIGSIAAEVHYGRKSPLTAKELLDRDDATLLEYLKEWVPAGSSPFEDSRGGLGDELKKCVIMAPERLAKLARSFRPLHPHYVATLLWGLHEVVSTRTDRFGVRLDGPSIDWASVLELAQSTRPGEIAGRNDDEEDSRWARQTAADIAQDLVRDARVNEFSLLEPAGTLVEFLLDDSDPSPNRVKGAAADDSGNFALGTVRGQAVYAALSVAGYLYENGRPTFATTVSRLVGALERRAREEPSEAIRRVLGGEFPRLVAIDAATSASIARQIFYDKTGEPNLDSGAWVRYLAANQPHPPVFEVLKPIYIASVASASFVASEAAHHLGTHLLWLAALGTDGVVGTEGLLSIFSRTSSVAARHSAASDFGRAILNATGPISPKELEQLVGCWNLWESSIPVGAEDLVAFGWWFSSTLFDPKWALATLARVLTSTRGGIDWANGVFDRTRGLARQFPAETVSVLELMVEGSHLNSDFTAGEGALLDTLRDLRGTPIQERAEAIVSRLQARGWTIPGDLLD